MANPALENLKTHQRQLDADGIEVGVSRQALEETIALVGQLQADVRHWQEVSHELGHCAAAAEAALAGVRTAVEKIRVRAGEARTLARTLDAVNPLHDPGAPTLRNVMGGKCDWLLEAAAEIEAALKLGTAS